MVGIIDYKTGNLKSVENALYRAGVEYTVTADSMILRSCSHIILPGVGDAGWAMKRIAETGIAETIPTLTQPVMGICLGMQIMCSYSEEGETPCLGIFPNRIGRIPEKDAGHERIKVPHIGWNSVRCSDRELFDGIRQDEYFYFVHSYCADVNEYAAGVTFYGTEFGSLLRRDNFIGCQFHPEKSGTAGERLLKNFLKMK